MHIKSNTLFLFIVFSSCITAWGQNRKGAFLTYAATYQSAFTANNEQTENELFDLVKKICIPYRDHIEHLNDWSQAGFSDRSTEFEALFFKNAKHIHPWPDMNNYLKPSEFSKEITKQLSIDKVSIHVREMAIAFIEPAIAKNHFNVVVNLVIEANIGDEVLWIENLMAQIQVDWELSPQAQKHIIQIDKGQFVPPLEVKAEKLKSWHSIGLGAGATFFPQASISSGISAGLQRGLLLNYLYTLPTKAGKGKLSLALGFQAKYNFLQTSISAGQSLLNPGFPNQLEIEFISNGVERLQTISAEALLGLDIRFGDQVFRHSGLLLAFTPRLSSYSFANFSGTVAYNEYWGDDLRISNIFNCGLRTFEGEDASMVSFNGRVFPFSPGFLIRPYIKRAEHKRLKYNIGLDLQFFPGATFLAGESVFLRPFSETTGDSASRLTYTDKSMWQAVAMSSSELYVGLHLSFFLGSNRLETIRNSWQMSDQAITSVADGMDGKAYLILSGDITDAEAAARIHRELGPATQLVWIINTSKLENVVIPETKDLLNIRIENNANLKNINFPELTEVYEKITILNNPSLEKWQASRLRSINEIVFQKNNSYEELYFPALQKSIAQISINQNEKLRKVSFPRLENNQGSFYFSENNALQELHWPILKQVEGGLSFYLLDSMKKIDLGNIKTIVGGLNIGQNKVLTEVVSASLSHVGEILEINANPLLSDITFPELSKLQNGLLINANPSLEKCQLENLTESNGDVTFNYNSTLKEINLPAFSSCSKDFTIYDHTNLAILNLPELEILGGELKINQCPALNEMDIKKLKRVHKGILIEGLPIEKLEFLSLENAGILLLNDMAKLQQLSIPNLQKLKTYEQTGFEYSGNSLRLSRNFALKTLSFPMLEETEGTLQISENTQLENIECNELLYVGGNFHISEHKALNSLRLPKIESIGKNLEIWHNYSLKSIDLKALTTIGRDVSIQFNHSLRNLTVTNLHTIGGNCFLQNNSLDRNNISNFMKVLSTTQIERERTINISGQLPPIYLDGGLLSLKQKLLSLGYEFIND